MMPSHLLPAPGVGGHMIRHVRRGDDPEYAFAGSGAPAEFRARAELPEPVQSLDDDRYTIGAAGHVHLAVYDVLRPPGPRRLSTGRPGPGELPATIPDTPREPLARRPICVTCNGEHRLVVTKSFPYR